MSFNRDINEKKKNDRLMQQLETDDMKIKSHLNASLDLEGIYVSEALVKRTLKAIKQSEGELNSVKRAAAEQEGFAGNPADAKLVTMNPAADTLEEKSDSSDNKASVRKNSTGKVIPWCRYIFRTAGIAAAALLMVVGLRYMDMSSKKNSTGMPDMSTEQDTAENETAASGTGSSDGTAMQPKESLADSASDKANQTENSESKVQGTEEAPSVSKFTASPAAAAYDTGADSKASATAKDNSSTDQTVAETPDSSKNRAEAKAPDNKHTDASASQIEASGQETAAEASENNSNSRGLAASLIEAPGEADTKEAGGGGSGNNSSGNAFSGSTEAADGSTKEQDVYTLTGSASGSASFRDIFLSDPEQAQYVKIKDDTNNTELMLTAPEDIQSFYAFMDQHKFSSMSNTLTVENYTVEVKSLPPDEYVYTMTIGDGVSIVCDTGDTDNIGVYSVSDPDLLLTNMENFYNAYSR